jgi:hypothetical protein
MTETQELQRSVSEWLDAYEEFLGSCYRGAKKWNELFGEEIDELFDRRSGLAQALKAQPDALTAEQRKHLRALDKQLRELKPFYDTPYYAQRARRFGYPKSHWWWYVGEPKTTNKRRRQSVRGVGRPATAGSGRKS